MAQRQLIIERPSQHGKQVPTCVQMHVDDQAAIGPWVTTLATRLGYPLVDAFGSPLTYRLRSVAGEQMLPTAGRFADTQFPSGSRFILEPERQRMLPMQKQRWDGRRANQQHAIASLGLSRRSLMSMLTAFSFLGFGSGVTTAFAQRLLTQPTGTISPITVHTIFDQHQQAVRTLTWSPDGGIVASGDNSGVAFAWNVDGTVLYQHQFPTQVHALAWSPDGAQLLAATGTTVSFLNTHTGTLLAENAEHHTAPITSLGWVQGPLLLALSAGTDKTAVVWNAQSYQPLIVFRGHTSAIEALAVLGTTVVTASEGGVTRVWSALSGQEIHGYYVESQSPLRAAAFSSTGNVAVGGDDGVVSLWRNGQTCQQQVQDTFGGVHCVDAPAHLQRQSHPIRAITFSPDGTLLAIADDTTLLIWSVQKRIPLLIQPQTDALAALSWSPSGQLLAGACGSQVTLWQIHL